MKDVEMKKVSDVLRELDRIQRLEEELGELSKVLASKRKEVDLGLNFDAVAELNDASILLKDLYVTLRRELHDTEVSSDLFKIVTR